MEKKTTDPWQWGKYTSSVQAVEIKQAEGTLYCSGQVAIDANGQPISADMNTQLVATIQNLEQLISEAGYEPGGIVRLNVYTTSTEEFFASCLPTYQTWIAKYGIQQATTMLEVKALFGGLTIELEVTVVK
ncbi:RidA family protein [Dyadobacter jiangsuensis]|uniref:Enamine deaminase RidA (YjgF/YER057c/UK114 family) n=1 Tax=Dyadobacter jiangsuensis TaxID=1591085 RepID=A0A2P8GCK4_9BACT|nr:RidA family protein [Dyadobacter jiangsuensis]PSL31615.1 enamine deaminase RidA (YjgF/YER057c/UK114 family) [Dyadobacter jiangsuensis]